MTDREEREPKAQTPAAPAPPTDEKQSSTPTVRDRPVKLERAVPPPYARERR